MFDETTLKQSSSVSRSITGVVYWEFGDFCFPAERWDDFAVVITTWWLDALHRLDRGIDSDVELFFMDGPYHLAATRVSSEDVKLRCIERRRTGLMRHEEVVKLVDVREQVGRLAREVAAACTRASMQSSDLDKLKGWLPR